MLIGTSLLADINVNEDLTNNDFEAFNEKRLKLGEQALESAISIKNEIADYILYNDDHDWCEFLESETTEEKIIKRMKEE